LTSFSFFIFWRQPLKKKVATDDCTIMKGQRSDSDPCALETGDPSLDAISGWDDRHKSYLPGSRFLGEHLEEHP